MQNHLVNTGGFFDDTARVMYFSALRRTRAGRGQRAAGPPLPYLHVPVIFFWVIYPDYARKGFA